VAKLPLTIACGPYDRMAALADGRVSAEGIDVAYIAIKSGPEIFSRMIKGREFDVSEMSASTYLSARTRGDFPFVAIPVFPSKVFRHGYIFINRNSGIKNAADLAGRKVGTMGYGQTAAVWIRGILQDDHNIDLRSIQWLEGGSEAPFSGRSKDFKVPAGIKIEKIADDVAMGELLARGEIDAMLGARHPITFGKNPNVVRLFSDYRAAEKDYFQRTGIFPIMHTVVMREDLYKEHPWIAASLYKAFEEAKAVAYREMRFTGAMRYALPWLFQDLDEIDQLFGGDPFTYGLAKNQKSLQALARYLREQGFVDTDIAVDKLFAPIFSE
jgi:4,5-dihydroxyphthalate decarboxylase